MIDHEIVHLINREIDGANPPGESARLNALLESNPEARGLFEDLKILSRHLSRVEEVAPPPTLRTGVMNSLSARKTQKKTWSSVLHRVIFGLRPRGALRYAFVFSGGLAAGVLLYALYVDVSGHGSFEDSSASGTLIMKGPSGNVEKGETAEVSLNDVHASVTTEFANNLHIMNISLGSKGQITARIAFDPANVGVEAVRRPDAPFGTITVGQGEIAITSTGEHACTLFFSSRAVTALPVRLSILSAGVLLYEKEISLNPGQK